MTPDFILRTAELSSAAPAQWAQFIHEFTLYTDALTRELLIARREDFEKMQGRAVHAAQLLTNFKNARATANKLKP